MKLGGVLGLALVLMMAGRAAAAGIDATTFKPGAIVQVDDAAAGDSGFYMVWVPQDYTANKAYPVVVNITGRDPVAQPFPTLTKKNNFVVVGIQAGKEGGGTSVDDEAANVKRILAALSKKMKLDQNRMFIGGTFLGGANASAIADATPDMWAGLIIIGTGKTNLSGAHVAGAGMQGKPVLIGTGERDPSRANVDAIVERYKSQKAEITQLEFKGGVSVGPTDEGVFNWLMASGQGKAGRQAYEAAEMLEKAGKPGAAYARYAAIEKMEDAGTWGKMGKDKAAEIESKAQDKIAAAMAMAGDGKYAAARAAYEAVAAEYVGSPFAEMAWTKIREQDNNPAVLAAAVDAKADAMESTAKAAEGRGDLATARALYEKYVTLYPKATRFAEVKEHLEALKAIPASTQKAASAAEEMDKDCKGTMMLVEGYVKNGHGEKALPLLEEMMKKYPGTEWAKKAAAKKAEIEKSL